MFVKTNYGVTFPVFSKVEVNGPNAHPLFEYLKVATLGSEVKSAPWAPRGPGEEKEVQWNFSKWLVVNGVPTKRYDFDVDPQAMMPDIMEELSKLHRDVRTVNKAEL